MLQVSFSNKGGSSGDKTPSINLSAIKPFLGRTKLKKGDVLDIKIVNDLGGMAVIPFEVNRADLTTAKAQGWNTYLFGKVPNNGKSVTLGVCEVTKEGGSYVAPTARATSHKTTTRQTHDRPTKTALRQTLRDYGSKAAAADIFGVSPRTLGRWCEAYGL